MHESQLHDILFLIVVIAAAFAIAKVIARLGLLTKANCGNVATGLSIIVGVAYGLSFEFERSPPGGAIVEFVLRIAFGAFVGGVLWIFIFIGVSGATLDNDGKKK